MQNQTFRFSNPQSDKSDKSERDFAIKTTQMFQVGLSALLISSKARLNPSLLDDSARLLHSITADRTRVHFAMILADKASELDLESKKDLLHLLTLLEEICTPLATRADANTKLLHNLLEEMTKQAGMEPKA